MTVVEELIVRIVGDDKDLLAAIKRSEGGLNDFKKDAAAGWKTVTNSALVAGAAVTAIGVLATRAALTFDTAFVGVMQNVNDTEANLADLRGELRAMARDTGFAAAALAGVAQAGGELGMAVGDARAFTETVAEFARATGQSLEVSAETLAAYVRTAQLAPEQVRPLTSAAVALTNALGGQEDVAIAIASRLDAVATAAGIAKPAILGLGGALGSIGIDAGKGGAAFTALIDNMGDVVQQGGKDLKAFAQVAGMSGEEFAAIFRKDAVGAVNAFIGGLDDVQQATGRGAEALQALGLGQGVVQDTLLRAAAASDKFVQAQEIVNREMLYGKALATDAAIANESAAVKFQKLQAAVTDLGIGIGAALLPAFEAILAVIGPVVAFLGRHEKVATALLVVIGATAGVILAANVALKAYAAWTTIVKTATVVWTGVQWLLNAALTANPIGIIIVAIAALVAAIIWIVHETIGWKNVGQALVDAWHAVAGFFQDLWQKLKDFFGGGIQGILAVMFPFLAVPLLIVKHWGAIKEFFVGLWDNVKETFIEVIAWFYNIGTLIVDGLLDGLKNGFGKVTGWADDAVDSVKDSFKSGFGIFSPSKVFQGFGGNMVEGLAIGLGTLRQAIVGPIDAARDAAEARITTTQHIIQHGAANTAAAVQQAGLPPPAPAPGAGATSGTTINLTIERIEVPVTAGGGDFDPRKVGDQLFRTISEVLRSVNAA